MDGGIRGIRPPSTWDSALTSVEFAALGGHGVVGVRLSRGSFVLGGLEFSAIGTAVRASGATHRPPAPFTCDLSGQDFAKLIMTGWVPARLVLGISIRLRHDDRTTTRQSRWSSGNVEVAGWTALVGQSRRDARDRLEADVRRIGTEGVVIATMQLRVRERDCPVQVGRPWPSCPSTRKAATLAGAAYRRRHTWQEREAAGTLDGCGMRIFRRRNAA